MIHKILDLVYWPDERLHQPCKPVTDFSESLERLHGDMIVTMYHRSGVGLAAPQVGHNIQMFVMVLPDEDETLCLVNPEILEQSDDLFSWREGCLSVPGYFEERDRPKRIKVRFQDVLGEIHEREFSDLWAFAIQHEMDHLKGKVFVDDLSPFKKSRVQKKIDKTLKVMG